MRFQNLLVFLFLTGIVFGSSNVAASDELFFNNVIEMPDADDGKRTIEVDASGNIFASFVTIAI